MAQDAQLVGDGGLALADAAGGLLLAQVVLLHELLQTLGLFDVVEIPALQVFDQRQHAGGFLVHIGEQAGDLAEPGQPSGAEPALSRHQLIAAREPACRERLRQLLQRARVKMLARLQGIRPDPRRRQIEDPARFQHRKAFCLCHSISPLQGLLAAIVGQPGRKNARILPIRHNKLWREIHGKHKMWKTVWKMCISGRKNARSSGGALERGKSMPPLQGAEQIKKTYPQKGAA